MEIEVKTVVKMDVRTVAVYAKIRDEGSYTFLNEDSVEVFSFDGYVPSFFPGNHYGDYLKLNIDLETGKILNWNATQRNIQDFVENQEENLVHNQS